MRTSPFFVGCVLCFSVAAVARGEEEVFPLVPHQETQELLAKWLATANRAQAAEHYSLLGRLESLAHDDYRRFVLQVVYFVHQLQGEEKTRATVVYRLFQLCTVPQGELAAALSPYLYFEDTALRKQVWRLFPFSYGRGLREGHPDLSFIRDHVTGQYQKQEIAVPLKRAVFETVPNAAFDLYIIEAEGMEKFRLARAKHQLDNSQFERDAVKKERDYLALAKNRGLPDGEIAPPPPWKLDETTIGAIRTLATSKHWWARMFVAEIMVQNKDFRDAELLKKLAEDDNELVRQSVASIDKPDPLRAGKVDR